MKFKYYDIEDTQEGRRIRIFNENWYINDDGDYIPSVTFIQSQTIGKGLIQWYKEHGIYTDEIMNYLAEIGSLYHKIIEDLLKYKSINYIDYNQWNSNI